MAAAVSAPVSVLPLFADTACSQFPSPYTTARHAYALLPLRRPAPRSRRAGWFVCSICVPVVLDSFSSAASPFLSVRTCAGCIYWLRGGSMLCPDTIPSVVGALSAAIARGRSDNEIALLAAVFTQLGDSLALILAAKDCPAKRTDSDVTRS